MFIYGESNERYSSWLEPLIFTDFYGDNGICEQHNLCCTFFYKECINELLCESGWRDTAEAEHEDYKSLQVHNYLSKHIRREGFYFLYV